MQVRYRPPWSSCYEDLSKFIFQLSSNSTKYTPYLLVCFQLSLEDFTHHADVYNPNSEGGAFKNIKVCTFQSLSTVNFINFQMPEIFAVICLKFKQIGQTLGYFVQNMQME